MIYEKGTLIKHRKGYTEVADGSSNYGSAWSISSGETPQEPESPENETPQESNNGQIYVQPESTGNRNIESPVNSNPTQTVTRVNNNASTLYEYYTGQGQALPSKTERARLFESFGLGSAAEYSGTSSQNTILLNKLKSGGSGAGSGGSGTGSGSAVSQDEIRANMATIQQKLAAAQARLKAANDAGITGDMEIPESITGTTVDENEERKAALAKIQANLEQFQLDQDSTNGNNLDQPSKSSSYLKTIEDLIANNKQPTAPDYAAEYKKLQEEQGTGILQTQINNLDSQIAAMQADEAKAMGLESNRMAPQSVINLRKSKLGEDFDERLIALTNQKAVLVNQLQQKNDTISTMMNFSKASYQDSVANYDKTIDNYFKMAQVVGQQEELEWNQSVKATELQNEYEQQDRKNASANWEVMSKMIGEAIKGGSISSYEDLDESQKQQIRSLEIQAGYPEGAMETIYRNLQPETKVLFHELSSDGTKMLIYKQDGSGVMWTESLGTGFSAKPAAGSTNYNELLSPTEAAALNVPYGTTVGEAAGKGIIPQKGTTSQAQQTVAGYAARIEQSEPILKSLESSINQMNVLSFEAQIKFPAALQSTEMQQYMQASRNFINSVLRRESGAVISPSEFAEARKQYLPQPGDSAKTTEQKYQNRKIILENYKNAAGNAYESVDSLLGNNQQSGDINSLRDKYNY